MMHQIPDIRKYFFVVNMRGDSGVVYIVMIMALLILLSGYMVGGKPKFKPVASNAIQYEAPKDVATSKKKASGMRMNAATAKIKPVRVTVTPKPTTSGGATTAPGNAATATPTSKVSPTTTQVACSNIAVDFLVDESASMTDGGKMIQVKNVLQEYIRTLPAKSLIAIQSFSKPTDPNNISTAGRTEQAFVEVGPNRDNVITKIDDVLNPDGATYMREGFKKAQGLLASKKSGYTYYLVLISDGVPELNECDPSHMPGGVCNPSRNYDYTQDPISTRNSGGDLAKAIKDKGVVIYSIGIYNESDEQVNSQLKPLLTKIASSPNNFLQASDANQLTNIFSQLSQDICK